MKSIEEYREVLEKCTKDKDVGVVVANAGVATSGLFAGLSDNSVESMLTVNVL